MLTAGEFAKLACTTKRTVLFYDEKGILEPVRVDPQTGYRYYESRQIIDFQVILLLRKLGFSLSEIEEFLRKNHSLKDLFGMKKNLIEEEVVNLQQNLEDVERYYENIEKTGFLVNPVVKQIKKFPIYYYEVLGSYSRIDSYCKRLLSMMTGCPKYPVTLTVFEEKGYRPKDSKLKIGVVREGNMKVRPKYKKIVKEMVAGGYKALTYTHNISGSTLSLMWIEMGRYRIKHKLKRDPKIPYTLELYIPVRRGRRSKRQGEKIPKGRDFLFEIQVPIL